MSGFSSKFRLKKTEIDETFADCSRMSSKCFTVLYRTTLYDHARLGIVVSKQKMKRAYDRNKTRRIVRESFRHHHKTLKGVDIIVLKRSECIPADKQALRCDIDTIWPKLAKVLATV